MMLLYAALFSVVTAVGGYFFGTHTQENSDKAAQVKATNDLIIEHNANTVIDMQAAYDAGQREAAARKTGSKLIGAANAANIALPYVVACRLDPERKRVLVAAIEAANGAGDAGGGVSAAVRTSNSPGK